tara:strand:- start:77 stop:769 length:693 start_codon:yes stop_codon:yes gene_type:complete
MEDLIKLQDIDTKLKDIDDLLGDLPVKVEDLNLQEEEMKNNLLNKKNRLKELEVDMHKKEVGIASLDDKVSKLKDQLFLVTNNKQYDALITEIDHFKSEKTDYEDVLLEYLEEKEETTESIEKIGNDLENLSESLVIRREKLQSIIEESAEEKLLLNKQREKNIQDIDQNILTIYDRVIEARNGLAVVKLEGYACGGCGAHIPPQIVSEVRAKLSVHTCGVCGRFLYYDQ